MGVLCCLVPSPGEWGEGYHHTDDNDTKNKLIILLIIIVIIVIFVICHPIIADESTIFFTQLDDAIDTYIYTLRRLLDPSTPLIGNTH